MTKNRNNEVKEKIGDDQHAIYDTKLNLKIFKLMMLEQS